MRLKEEDGEGEEKEKEEKDCATACDSLELINEKLVTRSTAFPFGY